MAMIAAVFCSCGQQPAQERGPRPVKLAEVTSLSRIEKSYSGVVSPDQFSDLAFKMSGPLVAMNVLEGQRVKKGQVVAEIDPTDYKLDYDAKRASFQRRHHRCNAQRNCWPRMLFPCKSSKRPSFVYQCQIGI